MQPQQHCLIACPPAHTCCIHLCVVGVPGQPALGEMSVDVVERMGYDVASYIAADPEMTYSIAGIQLHGRFRLAVGEGVLVLPKNAVALMSQDALHGNVILDQEAP